MKNASAGSVPDATPAPHVFHREDSGVRLGAALRRPQKERRNNARHASGLSSFHRQDGYAFLIILVALAIVGYLARDSIMRYIGTLNRSVATGEGRHPAYATPAGDATRATPAHSAPVERARAVDEVVRKQHEQLGKRIDAPR